MLMPRQQQLPGLTRARQSDKRSPLLSWTGWCLQYRHLNFSFSWMALSFVSVARRKGVSWLENVDGNDKTWRRTDVFYQVLRSPCCVWFCGWSHIIDNSMDSEALDTREVRSLGMTDNSRLENGAFLGGLLLVYSFLTLGLFATILTCTMSWF